MFALIRRFKRPLIISGLLLFAAAAVFLAPPGRAAESDAIAVRVLPNLEHDSIEVWYKKQGYQGSPQSLTVDGYEAIRDGRTVFVNAANIDLERKNIYTNVYLISYNQESEDKTQDILGQLISHWKFNSNLPEKGLCSIASVTCSKPDDCASGFICSNDSNGPSYGKCVLAEPTECLIDSDCPLNSHCDSLKAGLVRDINRLGKLSQIEDKLEAYKNAEGSYPNLSAGSYLPGVTMSVWPSWTENFRDTLKLNASVVDPINSLGSCPGFESGTCWDPQAKRFFDSELVLPAGSYAMIYKSAPGGTAFNVCATFETPRLGYDTTNRLLTSKNCVSRGGYQGGIINQPPYLVNSFLKGEANKEFNGYLRARDPEGDIFSWRLSPAGNFSSWSGVPVLEATNDPSQKKVYATSAGSKGVYPMILTLTDNRGAATSTPLNLEISDVMQISIEANGVSYNSSQSAKLQYNFIVNSSDAHFNFNLSSPNATLNAALAQAVRNAEIFNINSHQKQVALIFSLSGPLNGKQDVRISASDTSGSDAKTVVFDFIRDPLTFNFFCDNLARLGKPYQVGGAACLLGPLTQEVRTISYQVNSNPFNLVVENSGGNAFLKSTRVRNGDTNNPNVPTTTILTLTASDNFGETQEKKLALRINTFCGDGIKQNPNSEGRGGPSNNGIEQCDGLDGLVPPGQISNSSAQQYACTTPPGVSTPFPINSNEHCTFKAPKDGGGYCGDGFCQVSSDGIARESCSNCPSDCGACQCLPQCSGRICGDDGCGTNPNACGTCGADETCNNGICEKTVCERKCDGRNCGSDSCGGNCGICPVGETCNAGLCEKDICVPKCLGKTCGPDSCNGTCGTCGADETCNNGICEKTVCERKCDGRNCGPDSCGDNCGICPVGETCNAGLCEKTCTCNGKTCGADSCGNPGVCGTCAADQTCNAGICEKTTCLPSCSNKTCGDDGCGNPNGCGTCASGESCNAGICEKICTCDGKTCGADSCGNPGVCGTCGAGQECVSNQCKTICIPNCGINVCGDDGCGGTCGTCNSGETCIAGTCCTLTATTGTCGDRDTFVYFNGAFISSVVEESPLLTNTVPLRPGKNYFQIKVFDNGRPWPVSNYFSLSASLSFSGCRTAVGKLPAYSINTGSLSSWRCTANYNSSWNSSAETSYYNSWVNGLKTARTSPEPNTNDSFCSKNSAYQQSYRQIWANEGELSIRKDKTIYCIHSFDLTEIIKQKKAAMTWCGDDICNSGETNTSCPTDCPYENPRPPRKPPMDALPLQ